MYGASKAPLFYILFDIFINKRAIKNPNDTFLKFDPHSAVRNYMFFLQAT